MQDLADEPDTRPKRVVLRVVTAEEIMGCRLSVKQGEKMNAREAMGWTNSINEVLSRAFPLTEEGLAKAMWHEMRGNGPLKWEQEASGIKVVYLNQARAVLDFIGKGGR